MAPLQESTLVEAIMSVRSQVDFLWQFFVTVHIAIFALLFIYDHAVDSLNAGLNFSPCSAWLSSSGSTGMLWRMPICYSMPCRSSSAGIMGRPSVFTRHFMSSLCLLVMQRARQCADDALRRTRRCALGVCLAALCSEPDVAAKFGGSFVARTRSRKPLE